MYDNSELWRATEKMSKVFKDEKSSTSATKAKVYINNYETSGALGYTISCDETKGFHCFSSKKYLVGDITSFYR